MKYMKRKDIAAKIGEKCHTSTKRAIKDILPYVQKMVVAGNEEIVKSLELNPEQVEWLKKNAQA